MTQLVSCPDPVQPDSSVSDKEHYTTHSTHPVDLNFRQIHLDFHTSESIEGIGAQFDAEAFADTLDRARVNSVTIFSRCHHGWLYYGSKAFPERIHPHLTNRNLLKEQIEACHRRNIRTPIYLTVQWDNYTAQRHPEWRVVTPEGQLAGTPPYAAGFYRYLCVNSPYRDFLKAQITELFEMFPVDGLFVDIVIPQDCSCRYCLQGMLSQGLNPLERAERMAYARDLIADFNCDMTRHVQQYSQDCTIFYNAGHVGPGVRKSLPAYTHLELESVPSGGWGYIHFPMTIRYARNLGVDCLGMTAKFQSAWGDCHSFKNQAALQYECFRILAFNAKCSVGDQLHPSGKLCDHVYGLVGSVFAEVEKKESWCRKATAVTEIGVLTPEEFAESKVRMGSVGDASASTAGVVRMLEEAAHQFDIIDSQAALDRYKLLILPDRVEVSPVFARKLKAYLRQGGAIIASYESGVDDETGAFSIEDFGVRLTGRNAINPEKAPSRNELFNCDDYSDYVLPEGAIGKGLPRTEHVMYMKAAPLEALDGTEVLANVISSYFDRTWEHFSSHQQTPSSGRVSQPAVVRKGNVIFFAHPIFMQYRKCAPRWCRTLVLNVIKMLIGDPLVKHDGPTTVLATLNEQPAEQRQILHLLHYIPERRSTDLDTIEDVIPLYQIAVSVRCMRAIKSVRSVPEAEPIDFEVKEGRVHFTLPKLNGHQMIELAY